MGTWPESERKPSDAATMGPPATQGSHMSAACRSPATAMASARDGGGMAAAAESSAAPIMAACLLASAGWGGMGLPANVEALCVFPVTWTYGFGGDSQKKN